MDRIKLKDLEFSRSIPSDKIQESIRTIADRINEKYQNEEIIIIGILNGSFMFVADLMKHIKPMCQVSFLKLASYEGTSSTGSIKQLIGLNESLEGKHVIIAEDIVDSGVTLKNILQQLSEYNPQTLEVATLLYKPEACRVELVLDYIGLEIPNDFIVGYGLDYDGYGRNYPDIYTLVK